MPLIPGPSPTYLLELAKELQEAMKATLLAAEYTRPDGIGGVNLVDLLFPQPGGQRVAGMLRKADYPAVQVFAAQAGRSQWAIGTYRYEYICTLLCSTQSGDNRAAFVANMTLRDAAISAVLSDAEDKSNTWLASGHEVDAEEPNPSQGEPTCTPEDPNTFLSISTLTLGVLVEKVY